VESLISNLFGIFYTMIQCHRWLALKSYCHFLACLYLYYTNPYPYIIAIILSWLPFAGTQLDLGPSHAPGLPLYPTFWHFLPLSPMPLMFFFSLLSPTSSGHRNLHETRESFWPINSYKINLMPKCLNGDTNARMEVVAKVSRGWDLEGGWDVGMLTFKGCFEK